VQVTGHRTSSSAWREPAVWTTKLPIRRLRMRLPGPPRGADRAVAPAPGLLTAYLYIAMPEVDILICRRQGLPGLPWRWHSRPSCCRTGPSPLAVKLIAGHGAWGGREKLRPGRPDAARLEDGLRLPGGCLEAPGDPGPEEGRQPGIIQRAGLRQAAKPGTSRWSPPVRSRLPGRSSAQSCPE
jgi:hypothetical protein